jgi:hypothetical protein
MHTTFYRLKWFLFLPIRFVAPSVVPFVVALPRPSSTWARPNSRPLPSEELPSPTAAASYRTHLADDGHRLRWIPNVPCIHHAPAVRVCVGPSSGSISGRMVWSSLVAGVGRRPDFDPSLQHPDTTRWRTPPPLSITQPPHRIEGEEIEDEGTRICAGDLGHEDRDPLTSTILPAAGRNNAPIRPHRHRRGGRPL